MRIAAATALSRSALAVAPRPAPGAWRSSAARRRRDWRPAPTTAAWQWQLQGKLDTGVEAARLRRRRLRTPARRRAARCTASGRQGDLLPRRRQLGELPARRRPFPRSVIGDRYEGFPDERWLDIRRFHLFAGAARTRIAMCARKGFDAVEPDNIAGWENKTGFEISPRRPAPLQPLDRPPGPRPRHGGGAEERRPPGRSSWSASFDFAIVEQCFQYEECGLYRPFVERGKAVFEAEYELEPAAILRRGRGARLQRRSASPTTSSPGPGNRALPARLGG